MNDRGLSLVRADMLNRLLADVTEEPRRSGASEPCRWAREHDDGLDLIAVAMACSIERAKERLV